MLEDVNLKKDNEPSKELIQKISDFYGLYSRNYIEEGNNNESVLKEKLDGELSFYKSTLNSLKKAKRENTNKEIIALFDIDETLVHAQYNGNKLEHIIRPSTI